MSNFSLKLIDKYLFAIGCLCLCSFLGCTAVLKEEDIFLEAQKIKAHTLEITKTPTVEDLSVPTPTSPLPVVLPLTAPENLSTEENLFPKERHIYKAKYLGFAVGEFILINNGKTVFNGKPAYCFELISKTTPFFTLVFGPKDRYISYVDANDFIALRYEEYIKEGTLLESSVDFDQINHTATYKNFLTGQNKQIKIPDKVFDVICGGFYLRMLPWGVGDTTKFNLYRSNEIYDFIALLHSQTEMTFPSNTNRQVQLLKPYAFQNGKQIKIISAEIFLSTDKSRVPLRAILKSPLGNVSITLVESL